MKDIIGIDFDNTIAIYDDLIHKVAVKRGLIDRTFDKNKRLIRDHLRTFDNGEIIWQKVQSVIYGKRMHDAKIGQGFMTFMSLCKKKHIRAYIISHKTRTALFDEANMDLRETAIKWMKNKGLFDPNRTSLTPGEVYFEDTRIDKLHRIEKMQCTYFVDDLEETFYEYGFPKKVKKILYDPRNNGRTNSNDMTIVSNWAEITRIFS